MTPPANTTTFAAWIESRKNLTEDDLLAIDTLTQRLIETRAPGKSRTPTSREKTFIEWTEMFSILTEEDVSAIDALTQALIKTKEKPPPPPPTDWLAPFKDWAGKQAGFPIEWLIEEFSRIKGLTFAETSTLTDQLEKDGWKPPTPPEVKKPKPPRTGFLLQFLAFARARPGFQLNQLIFLFSMWYLLTAEEIFILRKQIAELPPEQRPKEPEPEKPKEPKKPEKPVVPKELVIKRTPYPKWWKDSLNAKIDLTAPGSATLATVSGRLRLYVATIVITVTGETVITINFGNAGTSGPIYLGGTDQPMGMVIAMGNSPAPCGSGPLTISATDPGGATPSIGGFATCFAEES